MDSLVTDSSKSPFQKVGFSLYQFSHPMDELARLILSFACKSRIVEQFILHIEGKLRILLAKRV